MGVSNKVKQSMDQGSWIRQMFEEGIALKKLHGDDNIFDLSLGNPILEPPPEFLRQLRILIDQPPAGMHRYMPNAGYLDTRAAVATGLFSETGVDFSADHVVMTCGAGGALNVVMKTLLDPGDEVVVLAPYFVEYLFYADNHGGVCRIVPPDENYYPDMRSLESSINSKTRIVLTSSPNNPTGVVFPPEILSRMTDIIQKKETEYDTEIFLISDEPYRKILFDDIKYAHIFPHHIRSIVATSHSKDLALAGERIGFLAVNPGYEDASELVDGLTFCNRILGFVNAPATMQLIVKHLQSVTVDVGEYQSKRDILYAELTDIGYSVVKPQGAFYMFPRSPIQDDVAFVDELRNKRILVVPGRGFGVSGHFRIAYCVSDATLEGSLPGFRAAFEHFS